MSGFGEKLTGDAEHFPFEERVFHLAMLFGIFMNTFGTCMDLYYRANISVDLTFIGCWILTYYLSKFRGYFNIVSVISTGIFVFAFIPYMWIYSGGSSSILPFYTIVFIAIVSIILKGKFRIFMVLSVLTVELLLICRDAYEAGSFLADLKANISYLDLFLHGGVILGAMACLIILYSSTYMKEKERSKAYANTIEEQYQQQQYYMENLEVLIDKLKSERHDFNNHLGVIYGLLENEETEEAKRYTTKLVKTAQEYQNIVNIPQSMLRAMLNYKLSTAKEQKIDLRLQVSIPAELDLNEFDLTVILGNLLDNAMEACVLVAEERRYISLSIRYQPDYLILQLENPMKEESDLPAGGKRTTKLDAENHGFGLRNIEYLVNKHNGLLEIEPANGVFKVSIGLLANSTN